MTTTRFVELPHTTFSSEKIDGARALQKFIINSIEVIEKDLFVLSSEFGDWEDSKRRIDILCLDKDANLVVIELKRTEDGGYMELQSIRYAAMVLYAAIYRPIVHIFRLLQLKKIEEKDAWKFFIPFYQTKYIKELWLG